MNCFSPATCLSCLLLFLIVTLNPSRVTFLNKGTACSPQSLLRSPTNREKSLVCFKYQSLLHFLPLHRRPASFQQSLCVWVLIQPPVWSPLQPSASHKETTEIYQHPKSPSSCSVRWRSTIRGHTFGRGSWAHTSTPFFPALGNPSLVLLLTVKLSACSFKVGFDWQVLGS